MTAAVVGAGRMGRRHIHVVRSLGLQLVGVADVSRTALDEARREHELGEHVLFDSPEKLFATVVPECLIVSTTADSHAALTCMAAERGAKFILVEKPLATSLSECQTMIEVCRKHGVRLSVNHQMRFMEQYVRPKALLESAAYGGLKSMTVVAGNFGIAMNGTHYFEAFRYLTDEDPTEVTAWFSPEVVANPRGVQFEDRAGSLRVVTASGKRLYLETGADQGHGVHVTYAGRTGLIAISELTGDLVASVREASFRDLPTTRYGMPADVSRETLKPAELIDSTARVLAALIADHPDRVTAQQGMAAVEVLVGAYTSAENGSVPVKLNKGIDHNRVFPWS